MKIFKPKKKQRGWALLEAMIYIGMAGVAAGGAYYLSGKLHSNNQAQDTATAIGNMEDKIHSYMQNAGSYTTLTPLVVNNMSLVYQPLTFATGTSTIQDPWGNPLGITGNAATASPTFAITIGGTVNPIDKESCTAIATSLANSADAVNVGLSTAVTATNGLITGGSVYKAPGGVISPDNLATGCATASPMIALQYH